MKNEVLTALAKEISLTKVYADQPRELQTIYLGGGTPSLLSLEELSMILDQLRSCFQISGNAEITLEANPDDINAGILSGWLDLGINRLSLGVQSFNDQELSWMNRAHTAARSYDAIGEIKQAGFSNFSVDIIYGSPFLSDEELIKTIATLGSLDVPHISGYALTVEPNTILNRMIEKQQSPAVLNETQARHFNIFSDGLNDLGYEHYEISNFAKPCMRSLHNTSYWQGKPYYGFGPSAHSFDGLNKRKWNVANNTLYITSINKDMLPYEEEVLSKHQQINEYIMLSLRRIEGMDSGFLQQQFPGESFDALSGAAERFIQQGMLRKTVGGFALTREGKLFADSISAELFV